MTQSAALHCEADQTTFSQSVWSSMALAAAGAAIAGCHTSTPQLYNNVGGHGDDDDDSAGTVSDQAGGRHDDSGGLVRDHSVLPGGGVRDRAGGAGLWAHRGATPGANGPSAGDERR